VVVVERALCSVCTSMLVREMCEFLTLPQSDYHQQHTDAHTGRTRGTTQTRCAIMREKMVECTSARLIACSKRPIRTRFRKLLERTCAHMRKSWMHFCIRQLLEIVSLVLFTLESPPKNNCGPNVSSCGRSFDV
jgi:hypothetical protein